MTHPPSNWEMRLMPIQNHYELQKKQPKGFTLFPEDARGP